MKNEKVQGKMKNFNFLVVVFTFLFFFFNARSAHAGIQVGRIASTTSDKLEQGIVGYWNMDEGQGSVAHDYSGQGNTGTLTNFGSSERPWVSGATSTAGTTGSAVNFDGVDDYVNIGSTALTTGATTLTVWIKSGAASQLKGIASLNVGGVGGIFYQGSTGVTDAAMFGFRGTKEIRTAANAIIPGQWQFLSFVYNGGDKTNLSSYEIYINGISQSLTASGGNIGGTQTTGQIGDDQNGAFLNASLDEVRIYNRALSQSEIMRLYNLKKPKIRAPDKTGLVGYWNFNEGTGVTAHDTSGSKNNGALTNTASPATAASGWTTQGRYGNGLNFDGVNDYVDTNSNPINWGAFSMSAWIKTTSSATRSIGGDSFSQNDRGMATLIDSGKAEIINERASGGDHNYQTTGSITVNNGTWHHIVHTWDGTTNTGAAKLFVDGRLDTTATALSAGTGVTPTRKFMIGQRGGENNLFFNGSIDEVRIYNRVLTADQVYKL